MKLHTRTGSVSLGENHTVDVLEGGALKVLSPEGSVDLVGPGFWVAVTEAGSRLDNSDIFIANPSSD
jgi:hypothetical protein